MELLFNLDFEEISNYLASEGVPKYRAEQIWQGLYVNLWSSFTDFSSLPLTLREKLAAKFLINSMLPEHTLTSKNEQTIKTLFRLHDKQAIETVLMYYDKRRTLCISSQVGCAMGCEFCATGKMGFARNLSSGEICEQVIHFERYLKTQNDKLTNIVVMGMGEPFLNFDNTINAIKRLNNEKGFNFGERRFTISTVGIIPAINKFTDMNSRINLAISLHAANNEKRSRLLPINKKYPIEPLISACQRYTKITKRRISFEWALIENENDSPKDAAELANLLKGMLCHVNIIPLYPPEGSPFSSASKEKANTFLSILQTRGIPCSIRLRRGEDIKAGCGQLKTIIDRTNDIIPPL